MTEIALIGKKIGMSREFYKTGQSVPVTVINKVHQGRPHIVDAIKNGEIQLVVNTTDGAQTISDSYELRRSTLEHRIPYFTTIAGSQAMLEAISALSDGSLEVETLQSYSQNRNRQNV